MPRHDCASLVHCQGCALRLKCTSHQMRHCCVSWYGSNWTRQVRLSFRLVGPTLGASRVASLVCFTMDTSASCSASKCNQCDAVFTLGCVTCCALGFGRIWLGSQSVRPSEPQKYRGRLGSGVPPPPQETQRFPNTTAKQVERNGYVDAHVREAKTAHQLALTLTSTSQRFMA